MIFSCEAFVVNVDPQSNKFKISTYNWLRIEPQTFSGVDKQNKICVQQEPYQTFNAMHTLSLYAPALLSTPILSNILSNILST